MSPGLVWDRGTDYRGFQVGPFFKVQEKLSPLVTVQATAEAGLLAGGRPNDETKTTEEKGEVTVLNSPTENIRILDGQRIERRVLNAPGMEMDGLGNYQKADASVAVRLGEGSPMYLRIGAAATRMDIPYRESMLNGETGPAKRLMNVELLGNVGVAGRF